MRNDLRLVAARCEFVASLGRQRGLSTARGDNDGDLTANHGANESHQPLRFAQFASIDGLDDDQKNIVDLVVQFQRTQLAAEEEPDSF